MPVMVPVLENIREYALEKKEQNAQRRDGSGKSEPTGTERLIFFRDTARPKVDAHRRPTAPAL